MAAQLIQHRPLTPVGEISHSSSSHAGFCPRPANSAHAVVPYGHIPWMVSASLGCSRSLLPRRLRGGWVIAPSHGEHANVPLVDLDVEFKPSEWLECPPFHEDANLSKHAPLLCCKLDKGITIRLQRKTLRYSRPPRRYARIHGRPPNSSISCLRGFSRFWRPAPARRTAPPSTRRH